MTARKSIASRAAQRMLLTAAVASLGAFVLASPAANADTNPPSVELSDEQALQLDAKELAKDRGISVEDASREMVLDRDVHTLAPKVLELAGESIMGMWIDREPEWVLRVAVADQPALSRVDEFLAAAGVPFDVAVRVGSSEKRLGEAADLIAREAARSSGIAGVEVDVRTGTVVILAQSDVDVSGLARLAPEVTLRVLKVSAKVGDANRGGVAMSSCTAGFPVRKPSTSQVGLVTAGHCGNSQSAASTPTGTPTLTTTYTSQNWSSSADIQFNRMSSVHNSFYGSSASTTTLTATPANAVVGHYICHRGKTTGYSCGYVVSTTFAPTWSNACNGATCSAVFTRVDSSSLANQPGDSGGPWFNGGVPVGIHKGGLYGDYAAWSVYTPISKLSSLSVGVL